MRIEKLELTNFRGFEHLEMEFPKEEAGLVVLIGVNGSGKTSVLEAIRAFFKNIILVFFNERGTLFENPRELNKRDKDEIDVVSIDDVRFGANSFQNILRLNYFQTQVDLEVGYETPEVSDLKVHKFSSLTPPPLLYDMRRKLIDNEMTNIPIAAYYGINRFFLSNTKNYEKNRVLFAQVRAFEDALNAGLNFIYFKDWFIERENNENRLKIKKNDLKYTDRELSHVRNGVNSFLFDWGMQNLQGHETKFNKLIGVESSLAIEKNGELINLIQLSDGERQILLLVADIARRLTIANPSLDNPLEGEGVVLVDEIDLFLHPAWQRKIIPNLRKTFPNIQFIVTTHSPQVLSSVDRKNVIVLDNFKANKSNYTKGRDSNSILAEVFGVPARPEEAKQELRQLYRLIDDPKKEKEAEVMLGKLKEKYGENDPDLTRATLHLHFLTT